MQAGKLNRIITIQTKTLTYDADGYPIESWGDSISMWASVVTTGGGEFYAAQKLNASTEAVFKARYTTGITVLNRIKYGTRIFEILSLNEIDGMATELWISAKELTAGG